MRSMCSECAAEVARSARSCPACGVDLRIMIPKLVDLTDGELDRERERADLLAALLAGDEDAPPPRPPRWGTHSATMLDLELAPIRIRASSNADDLLPADPPPKRRRLRR